MTHSGPFYTVVLARTQVSQSKEGEDDMSYNSVRAGHLTSLSSASLAPAIVAMIYWWSVGRARGPDRVAGSLSVSGREQGGNTSQRQVRLVQGGKYLWQKTFLHSLGDPDDERGERRV